nr:hypothetical protein CFP56_06498 [Quercus suber]
MGTTENQRELERLENQKEELKKKLADLDPLLNNLRSTAFQLANYYFVFQGVILTIVCYGSETALKKSDRWYVVTLSILAVVPNSAALIKTGIRYIENQVNQDVILLNINHVYGYIVRLEGIIKSTEPNRKISISPISRESVKTEEENSTRRGYAYLAICMIFFLGFTALVLVGCWKFIGTQNEDGFNLPSNDKCIWLCNGAKCLNICSEYRYSRKIHAS